MRFGLFFAPIALLASACTTAQTTDAAPQRASHDCFRNQDINGWNLIDPHTVRVDIGPNHAYALTLLGNARDLDFTQVIAIRARGSNWICAGVLNDVEITGGGPIVRRLPVTGVARLPPDHPPAPPQGS